MFGICTDEGKSRPGGGDGVSHVNRLIQKYLANKKQPPLKILQWDYA
jgi:hypothetical protein